MTSRVLTVSLALVALALAAAGQTREFELKISGGVSAGTVSRSDPLVTVVLTNRSAEVLETGKLPFLNFHISPCFPGEGCADRSYYLFEALESRKLRENSEFRIYRDLSLMGRWKRGTYDTQESDFLTFASLHKDAIHLWADIKIPDGFRMDETSGKRVPKYREYRSNVLTVVR